MKTVNLSQTGRDSTLTSKQEIPLYYTRSQVAVPQLTLISSQHLSPLNTC
jgi:hypothetical protein